MLDGWWRYNNVYIIVKTKEMAVDFHKARRPPRPLEVVSTSSYLGVHLSEDLARAAPQHLYFPRKLKRAGLGGPVLKSSTEGRC